MWPTLTSSRPTISAASWQDGDLAARAVAGLARTRGWQVPAACKVRIRSTLATARKFDPGIFGHASGHDLRCDELTLKAWRACS
jgi:hypothetical protein